MVGVKGFEPPAPCSQSTYATKLRYTPLDPVAVTAVGFAPDDEIYLTIPASICQHLFSIFPKKLLFLSSSLRSASWLPCVRGAVRRRAGLRGCRRVRGKGEGGSPSPISAPNQLFELLRCFGRLIELPPRHPAFRRAGVPFGLLAAPNARTPVASRPTASSNARPPGSLRSPSEPHSVCGRTQSLHRIRPGKPIPERVSGSPQAA